MLKTRPWGKGARINPMQVDGRSRIRPRSNRAHQDIFGQKWRKCKMSKYNFRTLQISTLMDRNNDEAVANILKLKFSGAQHWLCHHSPACFFLQTSCSCRAHTQCIKYWIKPHIQKKTSNPLWNSTIRSICYVLSFAQMVLSHAEELELFHSTHCVSGKIRPYRPCCWKEHNS